MKSEKKYYMKLNIVRDISCILILLYHLNIVKGGFLAVCTFFTLSGYLSCMSAIKNKNFSIKAYYLNRIIKLYLPLIIVVFITVILSKIIPNINWINLKPETMSVVLGYNNFWQLNANLDYFTKNVNSPFIHLWYISILMQFELVFPIVFTLLKKFEDKGLNLISIVIVGLLTIATTVLFYYMSVTKDIMVVYYNTFARIFSILFGILLALIHYEYENRFPKFLKTNNSLIFNVYLIILVVLSIFVSAESKLFAVFMILTTVITTRMIKYSVIQTKKKDRSKIFTRAFAKITYEIYLVQYPVIFFMQNVPMNRTLKIIPIIALTFIIAFILNLIINYKSKHKVAKFIRIIFCTLIIILGGFFLITEKDHTDEMKELEQILNENAGITEQKNEENINTENNKTTDKEENVMAIATNSKEETKNKNEKQSYEITEEDKEKIAEEVSNLKVVGIGDSVLLGAIKELYNNFPNGYFDGKVSRPLSVGENILKDLKSQGLLF